MPIYLLINRTDGIIHKKYPWGAGVFDTVYKDACRLAHSGKDCYIAEEKINCFFKASDYVDSPYDGSFQERYDNEISKQREKQREKQTGGKLHERASTGESKVRAYIEHLKDLYMRGIKDKDWNACQLALKELDVTAREIIAP